MRKRVLMSAALFLFCVVGLLLAQQPVQITNGPTAKVNGTSAVVSWTTNLDAGSVVKYGTDANNLNQTAQMPWGGVTHQVTLQNLQPNATYYYQVQSPAAQGSGTSVNSSVAQFQTQGSATAAQAAPSTGQQGFNPSTFLVVAGPIPQQVRSTSATVWWETNQNTQGSQVKYGTSPATLNQVAQAQSSDGLSHSAQLTNLQPDTTYYFNIVRSDGGTSASSNFKTLGNEQAQNKAVQITNGPVIERLADNQAVIAWSTTAPSSSIVRYGPAQGSLNQTAQSQWTSGTHRVTISNLKPNTKYWFQIQSTQAKGTGSATSSGVFPFQTIPSGQAAMNIPPQF